jgi:hypothetical protein
MGRPKDPDDNAKHAVLGHSIEHRRRVAYDRREGRDELMPAIFFLSLPPDDDRGAGTEQRSKPERTDSPGYSGHLSFDGGFDQFGVVPRRAYPAGGEPNGPQRTGPQRVSDTLA